MNPEMILNHEAFRNMDPQQKFAYASLFERLEGKSAAESMPLVMGFMASMPKGRHLSQSEQEAMIEAVMSTLSEADRNKFNSILKMLRR